MRLKVQDEKNTGCVQFNAEREVQGFRDELGPFVVAADKTRIPMLFTNAQSVDSEIVYVNKSLLELTGYVKDDILGMPFRCLLAGEGDRVRMTPEAISGEPKSTIELSCKRRDRTVFDASILSSPVCDDDGKLRQHFLSIFDLTEPVERRVQDHLRQAELYRHSPSFIAFSSGPDHRFTFANTAYETLVGNSDLIGNRVVNLFPELVEQGFIELLDIVYRTGERVVGKNRPIQLRRSPGEALETRYIDFIYEPVRDASGTVIGLFCEGSDITEVRLISEKLEDVQAQLVHVSRLNAMGTMAATLAHEMNQPLAVIANFASGCSQILERSGAQITDLDDGLTEIAKAAERGGKIVAGLRDMTKRMKPSREVFDLTAALKESAALVRVATSPDVSMTIKGSSSLPVVGDRVQIQQVIVNLLRNACEAAAIGEGIGEVFALSTKKDGVPCVMIRDNGAGLPDEMREDPFRWIESAKPNGMGIGLSICRTIVESHGGIIALDETGPGGTSFMFTLPGPVGTGG